jgi:opacity protein-like surface antigen
MQPTQKIPAAMEKLYVFMVIMLLYGGIAQAADTGIYITPKIGYSSLFIDNVIASASYNAVGFSESAPLGGINKPTLVGGIAIGYDFWQQYNQDITESHVEKQTDLKIVGARTEVEYLIRTNAKQSWEIDWGAGYVQNGEVTINSHTIFLNGYLDFHTGTPFTPYIGTGAGVSIVKSKLNESLTTGTGAGTLSESNSETKANFAYNIGVGTAISITDNMAVDLNWRYVGVGKGEASASKAGASVKYEADLSSAEMLLGLRIGF